MRKINQKNVWRAGLALIIFTSVFTLLLAVFSAHFLNFDEIPTESSQHAFIIRGLNFLFGDMMGGPQHIFLLTGLILSFVISGIMAGGLSFNYIPEWEYLDSVLVGPLYAVLFLLASSGNWLISGISHPYLIIFSTISIALFLSALVLLGSIATRKIIKKVEYFN